MSDTTLSAIIDRVQAVLAASPLSLTAAKDAFSHDRQPNALLTGTYYLHDAGVQNSVECSNNAEARIDQIEILVARKVAFDATGAVETMETSIRNIERYLVADGPANGYQATLVTRRVTRPDGKDFVIGSLTMAFDYDYSKATS